MSDEIDKIETKKQSHRVEGLPISLDMEMEIEHDRIVKAMTLLHDRVEQIPSRLRQAIKFNPHPE